VFKPHYAECSKCLQQRLIVVKKMLCKKCNDEHKRKNNNGRRLNEGDAGFTEQKLQRIVRGFGNRTSKGSVQKRLDGTGKNVLVNESPAVQGGNSFPTRHSISTCNLANRKTNIGPNKKKIQPFGRRKVSPKNVDKDSEKTKQVFHRKKGIVRKKKVTGERVVFEEILEERGRYSQISGEYLGEGFNPWWFSHCVPKSIAPGLRLDKRNIILKTPDEHATWENKKHTIRDNPKWKWVFELEEKLKQEYYGRGKAKS